MARGEGVGRLRLGDDNRGDHLALPLLPDRRPARSAAGWSFSTISRGTRFGIKVDPHDGLLTQGAEGYALTWMDAKVGDWVVTPRRGKAVEINALWYNALRLLADWLREAQAPEAEELAAHADKTRASFNRRFWHAAGGYFYDVVDGENGDDAAFRPNQIFAIALEHPVLDPEYWETVVTAVQAKLLTPVGLRYVAPGEPDYKSR